MDTCGGLGENQREVHGDGLAPNDGLDIRQLNKILFFLKCVCLDRLPYITVKTYFSTNLNYILLRSNMESPIWSKKKTKRKEMVREIQTYEWFRKFKRNYKTPVLKNLTLQTAVTTLGQGEEHFRESTCM